MKAVTGSHQHRTWIAIAPPYRDPSIAPAPRQFIRRIALAILCCIPPSVHWTPYGPGQCCNGPDQLCAPATWAAEWQRKWSDLALTLPNHGFHFSYMFESTAEPPSFKISASADLDCDGKVFSLYTLTGVLTNATFVGRDKITTENPGQ